MTEQTPLSPHGRHFDLADPADLKLLVENGVIWKTKYVQLGLDALQSGAVKLSDCKNMPANIRDIVSGGGQ